MSSFATARARLIGPSLALLTVLGTGVSAPGCAEFDTTPVEIVHGSLGEEIVQVFCERMASEAYPTDATGERWKGYCSGDGSEAPEAVPPRLGALMANRARLVEALDRTLPEEMTDELGHFMGEILPFFDRPDERLPNQTRRLADFLDRLSQNDEAIAALERLGTRRGYRPMRLGLGVARPTMAYPQFNEFADLALELLLAGAAREEFDALSAALAYEMATMTPSAGPSDTLPLMRDLMFTEDPLFATGTASWVLSRDVRGIALPNMGGGVLPAPFADTDADGLADIDALGRFTAADGSLLALPTPFAVVGESGVPRDASGRALRSDATRYYSYFDGSQTMLAGLIAELSPWFSAESPTMMQMSRGLPVLMGPETALTQSYGAGTLDYTGFDTSAGPALDAVHALGEMMHRDETYDALVVTENLLRDHESATAGVLRSARYLANESDLHPEARLTDDHLLWDQLIDLLRRVSQEPGMLEAVLRAFSDPRSARLGEVYAAFMRNRDRVTYNPAAVNAAPVGLPLDEPVDHAAPDSFDNESLFQRTLALIDALNGVQVCNREGSRLNLTITVLGLSIPIRYPLFGTAGRCEIIRIDNVAEAYARSILGTYELELQSGFLRALTDAADFLGIGVDAALEESSGIDGLTRRPTAQALNRLVFWGLSDPSGVRSCTPDSGGGDCNSAFAGQLFTPVIDRHGNDVIERYHGTIFAWESPGFYEGMRPLLEVLHRPGYTFDPAGTYYFGELLGTLHEHWASPMSTETCGPGTCSPGDSNFSYHTNARSYEALVAKGLSEGELTERLYQLNLALGSFEVRPGVDGVAAMAAAGEVMLDPARSPGLADRRGSTTATWNDGTTTIPQTPLYLLLDALSAMDTAWEAEPERRAEFLLARHTIAEQFLGADTLGEEFRLRNQRARAILLTTLPFARERIDEHRATGDLVPWATGLDEDLAETMQEPLVAALIRFLDAVNEDPDARAAMAGLMSYLLSEESGNDAFTSVLYGGADALMTLDDELNIIPLMNALAESMAPNVNDVVASGGVLDIESSTVRDSLALVRDIQQVDDEATLRAILQNAVALPETGDAVTPLETIIDVIAEVNRATPNEGGGLFADDYRSVLGNVTGFIQDEDHGLERLNAVVQARDCLPWNGRVCASEGATMDAESSCYEGASCTCTDGAWRCTR